jgi:DNA-binding ferritin-like protein
MHTILKKMLTFRNNIKNYHWKTHSYSRHKATDKLVELLDEKIDRFVETFMGSRNERPKKNFDLPIQNYNDNQIIEYVQEFKIWLIENLTKMLYDYETDLLNIRDEILGDLNRFLYLATLN